MEKVDLTQFDNRIRITNRSASRVDSVSLIVDDPPGLFYLRERALTPDQDGLVAIGDLPAKSCLTITVDSDQPY